MGRMFKSGKVTIGNITTINYSNTNNYTTLQKNSFLAYDTISNISDTSWTYHDHIYKNSVKIGSVHNWSFIIGHNKFDIKNFYNHQGISKTLVREGRDFDNLQTDIKSFSSEFISRTIYSGQLCGEHKIFHDKTKIEWAFGYVLSNRYQPGVKRISFAKETSGDPEFPYYNQYYMILGNKPDPRYAGLLYFNTKENIKSYTINLEHKVKIGNIKSTIKWGIFSENKQRNFDSRFLGFKMSSGASWELQFQHTDSIFSNTNINCKNGIVLDELTNPSDSYIAENDNKAGYIAVLIPITNKLNIYTGVRMEKNIGNLNSFSSDFSKKKVEVKNDTLNFFPSLNISYNFNRKMLIRTAYGYTINRPEFREIAPYSFYDFELGATIRGNTALKNSYIHNYDFRFEFYPSILESIMIGVFYKNFKNPIEKRIIPAGSDMNYSFDNALCAKSYGAEIEIRKSFQTQKNQYLKIFKDFSVVMNGAYILSQVKFDTLQSKTQRTERQMQGQSPYIINAGLFYFNEKIGFQSNILFNINGKRILYAGDIQAPDIYEMPQPLMDITASQKIGKYITIKGGAQNILQKKTVFRQFVGTNYSKYQDVQVSPSQRYFTAGISVSF